MALQMGELFKQQQALSEQMEKMGSQELNIHNKRKQLAKLLLSAPLDAMEVV